MVVGVGDNALVEQLDPSTLALHRSESLPVKDNVNGWPVAPLLTATVDGPLWIAGGEDLWALDPTTGSVETEFDTGNEIVSMSTDPTGTLLYTSGQIPDQYGMRVTEYDAQTGQDLQRADKLESLGLAIGPGSVAATSSGVWVSIRTGMAGGAFELSAQSLSPIAPPPSKSGTFGTYEQFMGVGSSISEDTLWLTSDAQDGGNLTCADPTTGAVRASETTSVPVSAPIAIGTTLYAVASSGEVVVITPPAKCFG
jgi:outer membrane protein assembly factor BamB